MRWRAFLAAAAAAAALGGCSPPEVGPIAASRPAAEAPAPGAAPLRPAPVRPGPVAAPEAPARPAPALSAAAQRFAIAQRNLLDAGRLRTDRDPSDAPYDRDDLVRNFARIAFYTEFPDSDLPGADAIPLGKWRGRIGWRLGGDGLRDSDRAHMTKLADRLGPITGLRFEEVHDDRADLDILVLTEEGRRRMRDDLARSGLLEEMSLFDHWVDRTGLLCFAITWRGHGGPEAHERYGIIGIRAELPDLWRESCFDEEVVQSLGLVNDHPAVRPSIFNDDEEFAFLTRHDEDLLRILYDPRLAPGMTEAEAMPIVRRIAEELPDATR